MKKGLEERLGQLQIGNPDPALRGKVLAAAEAGLTERPGFSWRGWLAAWRVEALLAAGVAAAVVLLLTMEPVTTGKSGPEFHLD